MTDPRTDNILRRPEVLQRTGLSRSTLQRKIANGTFPAQFKLSERCSGWYESAVNEWVANPR
ncbi:AlpA family phage regulatory protein [Rhizorhabdus wittichii]|uniref:AlpA family phage regulatory protein n=1 Tax=Rhizorhabdus wittichii TaxID=160791 RepID=A0A975D3H1_9SPHN|nr:AlpA family phage regulatory protein [Rhizorhabdus wittichii]QTH21964.1 AlpA family phage regulatory protein [Rhizorhabdus wittichii]